VAHSEAADQCARWLNEFGERLAARDPKQVRSLFHEAAYWRDLLAFSWSIITVEKGPAIQDMLAHCVEAANPHAFALEDGPLPGAQGSLEAWFRFETKTANCRGHIRLRDGRCVSLLTCVVALKGHDEKVGATRDKGVQHGAFAGRKSWTERRREIQRQLGVSTQPYCLVIGGGQGGVTLAARLKMLNVPTLVIDKHARPGDAWRERYRSLCLHDPVWNIHLPYLPFPDHWPVFTPKDKMADWIEAYAQIMELDIWSSTEATSAAYDASSREWTVTVKRAGETITLRPKQLVIATGMSGAPHIPDYRGASSFDGLQVHSSAYRTGEGFAGKRCIVVGSNNSAHDICADLWEHGADVTMIQRSSTLVVRAATIMKFFSSKLYSEEALKAGITTEWADFIAASRPYALLAETHKAVYDEIKIHDADYYDRLARAGFMLDFGEDGSGLSMKYIRRGSGYYIDVGASELIMDGRVKLKSGVHIERVEANGVILSDGVSLPADLIVYATGFDPMERWIEQLISPDVARSVGHIWGLGSGTRRDPGPWMGELRNMWKPTRQQSLWVQGGNLQQARFYSRLLAVQIKARMEGIPTPVYDPMVFGAELNPRHVA